jgi:hypothetical protein
MRWIGATVLLAGCATGNEASQARVDHLSCLDRQMAEMRAAKSMSDTGAETRASAAACWRVFHSQVQAGQDAEVTAVECRQLDGYAQDYRDRAAYHDGRVAQIAAACRELGVNAEQLAAERDHARVSESAARASRDVPRTEPAPAVGCSRGDWGTCVAPVDAGPPPDRGTVDPGRGQAPIGWTTMPPK